MKKKYMFAYAISGLGIAMIVVAIVLMPTSKENKKTKDKEITEKYGTNLDEDLSAKAMIYAADKYSYTTEKYQINVTLKDNIYNIEVKTNDGNLVDNINIKSTELKKWQPNVASPEEIEVIDEPDGTMQAATQ